MVAVKASLPRGSRDRGQMATFLARVLDLDDARRAPFDDATGSAHRDGIDRVFAAGITKGCTETSFCPELGITREQAASFLYRAFAFPATEPRPFPTSAKFTPRQLPRSGAPVSPRVVTPNGPDSSVRGTS